LASLDGAPDAVCGITLQLLPFGSRAALETLGIVAPGDVVDGRRSLRVTPFAFAVMAEAAAVAAAEDDELNDEEWDRRAEAALAPVPPADVASPRGQQVLADALASRLR